mmetsp:Transcript_5637/g.14084  ORF Transcript_5637/g.14084 Transcript_5637/m.14084 type:complete len:231 (-) Transcript_5637:567-1259(-)|eukprot:CAMPEP_0197177104 /NCGR_PEP_ID=MMETSP1423-20130617/2830_1 /TAXON_ID=476441 /ORGANISM="Pseudo-nitzschia heimii, Strain UNC1101" /LENGTH=230 /DNA_ID=CAMNT_0042626601 /DNA_START=42 /DNA_END=734 /DNA_ORIENTATION=+
MTEGTTAQHSPVNVYSDDKVKRLMRTFGASIAFSFLITWFDIMISRPASKMATEMASMDPSEIIGIPFPLTQVTIFCVAPVFVLFTCWTVKHPSTVGWKILSFIKVWGLMFVIFGLCGVDIIATWQHSMMAALFLTALLCANLTEKRTSKLLQELPFYDFSDLLSTTRLYTTLGFIIPFSILSILDHGDQQQRWPVPVLMGGTYGFVVGSIVGIFLAYFKAKKVEKKEKK